MTTIKESSLFNWINLYFSLSSLQQFKDIPTLVLFIQSLFNHHEFEILNNDIPLLLNEINSIIPVCTILPQDMIDVPAVISGDQNQIVSLLGIIQTQYQAYTIIHTILQNRELSFTAHIPQFIPNSLQDVRNIIFSWTNYILSDYIGASLISPLLDLTVSSWQSGIHLLAIVHYHNPLIVPDLFQQDNEDDDNDLCTALQLLSQHYHIPVLFDTSLQEYNKQDESAIITYLVELIPHLFKPTKDETIQRHRDIERFKNQNPSSYNGKKTTTFTSTYTLQQLKITKTTRLKYSDGTEIPTDLEEFESRASTLSEKLHGLQHRLMLIVPTRSLNYSASSVDSMELFLTDDNTTNSTQRHNENSSHTSSGSMMSGDEVLQMMRVLHPLQAAEEDYAAYDKNFKSLQSEFQQLTDGDLFLLQNYLNQELKAIWRDHPKVTLRTTQLIQLHQTLSNEFEKSEITLSNFRRGFAFSRMCSSISHELDIVQNKMVKSITTHNDIEELEQHMEKTTDMVLTLKTNFDDLVTQDTSYFTKFDSISGKNQLVRDWVEEVRVWFTEAERIKKWIELRIDQLNSTPLPDPLISSNLPATQEQVDAFNISHSLLEKEIESFDKEDMARLRSHVKTLTGSDRADKDLSPADTTTIEITLTTLTTLDKLIHSLRRKSYDLQVLTQRVLWEDEYKKAMDWLQETDGQVDLFIKSSARWTRAEEEDGEDAVEDHMKRDRLMAKEKQKEIIVQQLLSLERKMAEFDGGQFTKTVDSFQDLDNTSSVELPAHLETRQDGCEQFFEDLMKRMTFARNVVEQRLNVMDFLYQTDTVLDDTKSLQLDLRDAETKSHPGDNDREMTARVQNMHERIVQLVTATAGRIPYPVPGLQIDHLPNSKANAEIQSVITRKRNDLILLSEDLDERLHSFRNVLQLHKRSKEYLDDAARLCDWADERVKIIRKVKVNQQDVGTFTVQDLQRLERDRDNILAKLKNGKENDVVDLLTRIQLLLETSKKLNVSSLDKESLVEVSQQLEERFDRLQQILEEHGLDLQALRKKMEDGNTYFENARSLRSFMSETRHSMPGLKQTCGFMTGQSEEQDKRRFEMLHHSLNQINTSYNQQQNQFAQLCSHFELMEPSKIENLDEMRATQRALEDDWTSLGTQIKDLESFAKTVAEWYNRQRRLSMVENDLLAGINEDIAQLAKSGWTDEDLQQMQDKIDKAASHLKETGDGIRAADNKEDALQTANYSCARDRHLFLTNKTMAALDNLNALRNNANKALAYSAFLGEADKVLGQVQWQKEVVDRRMAGVGNSKFSCQPVDTIDTLYKRTLASIKNSEKESVELAKCLESLIVTAKGLESEGYDAASVQDPIVRIKDKLDQLASTIELEKKQATFMRKIYIHAKAAKDLQTWVDDCSNAIMQLPTDVCMNDEQELVAELDHMDLKINEMRPTIQAFEVMESRIFANKDGNQLDLCEISLDRNEIKTAVCDRETGLLKAWGDLKKQHQQARQLLDSSKRGVEIARKVKSILMQVGDMKDRVSAVRICRNTHLDDGIENRDLKTVLSCPLTSIPTEHRLASAKAELTILDRDMETHLQHSIQELDSMLNANSNQNTQDIFSGQRTEITIAVRGLMDLMKAKRRAISEAEKMEGFLTVMEELEVLLLALTEVVARADPSNARVVDGNYSRTDLQALLIDLDTRYRYYEPKINDLLSESKVVAENLMGDRRVVDCIKQLSNKWAQLQSEAAAKKSDLMARIGPLGDTFDALNSTEGMLQEKGRKAASLVKKTSTPVLKQPPSPKMMQSTPRYMTGYNRTSRPSFTSTATRPTFTSTATKPTFTSNTTTKATSPPTVMAGSATAARANAKRTTGGSVSPTARRVAVRQLAAQQQRRLATVKTPENYVSDPRNDLDVALGDILNDSPYKIQVKMVPGEVGKYWFGNVNPKLAYCRILRSRMVMVRVGGGWVELSQFLRDHALLEGGNFVSGRAKLPATTTGSVTRDGFLNTTVGRTAPRVTTIRGGGGNAPTLRESRSTPFHRGISPVPYGHGIKTGNKFLVTVDGNGNKVEVKMTKANSKDGKFTTPRRMNM
ncbi:hypothetical protein EDC94DRAFT_161544 [Helicostylum pulchrum]|nr:hypothetical protein EDC94DRAFT_161544 [Helicostylum pulchrum]